MPFLSLSAFLDSFETPSASHLVFRIFSRRTESEETIPSIERRVTWENEEESEKEELVSVTVQILFSSSIVGDSVPLKNFISFSSEPDSEPRAETNSSSPSSEPEPSHAGTNGSSPPAINNDNIQETNESEPVQTESITALEDAGHGEVDSLERSESELALEVSNEKEGSDNAESFGDISPPNSSLNPDDFGAEPSTPEATQSEEYMSPPAPAKQEPTAPLPTGEVQSVLAAIEQSHESMLESAKSKHDQLAAQSATKTEMKQTSSTDTEASHAATKLSPPTPAKSQQRLDKPTTKQAEKNWKLSPPGHGDPDEKVVEGMTWYWCTKCAKGKHKGRWTSSHRTSGHTGKVRSEFGPQATAAQSKSVLEEQVLHAQAVTIEFEVEESKKQDNVPASFDVLRRQEKETNHEPSSHQFDATLMSHATSPQPGNSMLSTPSAKRIPSPRLVVESPSAALTPQTLFSALFSTPSSSVAELVPLEHQFEEIPMLLLTEMQKEDSGEVAKALETLGELLESCPWDSEYTAHRLGAHSIVVLAMRKFDSSEEVQTWGCCCLGLLALRHPDTALAIVQLGGLERVVNTINRFPNTVSLQRFGWEALKTMFSCVQSQIELNRQQQPDEQVSSQVVISEQEGMAIYNRFVQDMDGPRVLMRSMRKCFRVVRVLSPCCGIFSILAQAGHKTALKDAGAVSAVAVALENNPQDDEMNRYATNFMVAMFS